MADTEVTTFRIPRELKAAAAARAKAEYRTLTDVVVQALREYAGNGAAPVWAVPERERPVADFAEPDPPRVPLTKAQRAAVSAPPKRRRKPGAPSEASLVPQPGTSPDPAPPLVPLEKRRYSCCKHCKVAHGGHGDPCANGCA